MGGSLHKTQTLSITRAAFTTNKLKQPNRYLKPVFERTDSAGVFLQT